MPNIQLPLDKPNRNTDPTSLTNSLEFLQDCVAEIIDGHFSITQRPALEEFVDLGTDSGIDGLYWSDKLSMLVAVSGGEVWKIKNSSGEKERLSASVMQLDTRVSFAEAFIAGTPNIFMANGGKINYTDGATVTEMADAAAPTTVTHLGSIDTYLVCNDKGTESWYYTLANNPINFAGGSSYDSEMQVDDIEALFVSKRRIYIMGKNSIEPWYNQGVSGDPFARIGTAAFIDSGVFSPYTVALIDKEDGQGKLIAFLNSKRQIALLEGGTSRIISQPYNKILQEIKYADDAVMDNISLGGNSLLVITFKSSSKTYVYDYSMDLWYEWGSWENTKYVAFKAMNYAYAKDWNFHLIGDRRTGKIYKLNNEKYKDSGATLRALIRTGHLNFGSDADLKVSKGTVIRAKRGVGITGDTDEAPVLRIRKRDNNGPWSNWKTVDLGKQGDTKMRRTVWKGRGGKFFSRQYEIAMADDAPLVLSGAWENLTTEEVT